MWLFLAACGLARAGDVTIYRDTWGVPHIYGATAEAAAFGHGYAQAEDRLDDLLAAYLIGVGRAAEAFGDERLDSDRLARMVRHEAIARDRYPELDEQTRALIEAFVAGVRAYMSEHPEQVPAWAVPPEPYHVVALYRAFAFAWPFGQARGDLKRMGSHAGGDRGSNQWVVGPSRSASGAPIALIDPHLSWKPENRFYESHVHGGSLDFFGFSIIGTPVMALGHTDVFSLALTTGGPDCADVYEERLHPDDPGRYEYDGEWLPLEVTEEPIRVAGADGMRTETLRIERTRHGPILHRSGDRAYAMRTAYDREVGLVEQWLEMVKARNLGEFLGALRANQSLPQNIMYADVFGNIYYIRAGRVPVRPAGFRWDRPVPGWTSATQWRGVHPLGDLVQVLNPAAGYMQNCNNSPDVMLPLSPLTAERYLPYLFNSKSERTNGRGRRMLRLLGAGKLTIDDALRWAVDTYVDGSDGWKQSLAVAAGSLGPDRPRLEKAVRLLSAWDGRMDSESRAATLFRFWVRASREEGSGVPFLDVEQGRALDRAGQAALLEALERASATLEGHFGRLDVPWSQVNRVFRGDRSWPVAGLRADGISTLRSVRSSAPGADGVSRVTGGQMCTTVVVLKEGNVTSYSVTPYGQSNHPGSQHYTDQGQKLFSRGLLKPTWYGKKALLEHIESQRVLSHE